MFWWGIFITCSNVFTNHLWAYFTIISPIFISLLLFGFSGMPILEKNANRYLNLNINNFIINQNKKFEIICDCYNYSHRLNFDVLYITNFIFFSSGNMVLWRNTYSIVTKLLF